jgi:hypothetical protein
VSKNRKPLEDERTVKYDPSGILKAALASVDASGDAHYGSYVIEASWVERTLRALEHSMERVD